MLVKLVNAVKYFIREQLNSDFFLVSVEGCNSGQIEDPDNPGTCCNSHVYDSTKCECVSPQIVDPDNKRKCCQPDSTHSNRCIVGNSCFTLT